MTNGKRQSGGSDPTARLKEFSKEISGFADKASEEEKEALLVMLEDWRILGLLENRRHGGRREHPRKTCTIDVEYTTLEGAFKDMTSNISAGGMFIQTDRLLSVGQHITMTLSLANTQSPITITGEIIWSIPEGVGVRFKSVSKDLERLIDSL